MVKKRVSISGKIAAGKTTCSEYLIQQYGYQRVSFATPIKRIVDWFRMYNGSMEAQNALFKYLVTVNVNHYVNASRSFDILVEEIFPKYTDIDWSIEKSTRWRELLQEIGETLRLRVNMDMWMDYLVSSLDEDALYICDDMRYLNEFSAMQRAGFTLVRLQLSPEVQAERIDRLYGAIDPIRLTHLSETDLDHTAFHYVINADQDLMHTLHDIRQLVEEDSLNDVVSNGGVV